MNPCFAERARLRGFGLSLDPFPGSDRLPVLTDSATGAQISADMLRSPGLENLFVLQIEALWYVIRDGEILNATIAELGQQIRQYLAQ
jgi:hypothetical protein